jgi:hypothetical protein
MPNSFDAKIKDALEARHEPEAQALLAHAYWSALISLLALIAIGSVAYGAWEFMRPLTQDISSVTVGSPKAPLNRAELQTVLDGFDERNIRFEERRVAPALADPS